MIIDFTDEEIKDMAEGDAGGLGYHLEESEFERLVIIMSMTM